MGMFDSFKIKKDGKYHEIQTKQFECLLDVFNLGDSVPNITRNVNSFVLVEDDYPDEKWFGFVIYKNMFIDYVELDNENDQRADRLLETYIENPKLVVDRLLEILNEKNSELENKNQKINEIYRAVFDYIEFKNTGFNYDDDRQKSLMTIFHRYANYFKEGGTLEQLIKEKILVEKEDCEN